MKWIFRGGIMEKVEFKNACFEVLEILKYVKEEDLNKIPKEEIELLRKNANYEHIFEYNPTKTMKEQNISKLAKGIIASYFTKYIASKEQKQIIEQKRKYDLKNTEKKNLANNIVKNNFPLKENNEKIEIKQLEENKLIEYSKDKWYIKLLKFLGIKK